MKIEHRAFAEMTVDELWRALALRTSVFVVEQACAYQEVDEADPQAHHSLGWLNKELVAYGRICPPGTVYPEASIGRVLSRKDLRGKAYGKQIFAAALAKTQELYPNQPVKIQAQCYLEKFYRQFGFERISAPYSDFGIMHFDMLRTG